MAEIKHVGRVIATNKKCIVAYRTLPGDAYSCLIVPTENLPDIYHDAIINLVESGAAQSAYEFAEVLARTQFPDGAVMLPALHSTGRLIKAPTSAIEMTPAPNVGIQLSELNQLIAEQRGVPVDQLALRDLVEEKKAEVPKERVPEKKMNRKEIAEAKEAARAEVANAVPTSFSSPEDEAKFYRSQADKLAKEAAAMRRKAEELVPTAKKKVEA